MRNLERELAKISRKHKDDVVGLVVPEPLASMVRAKLRSDELGDLWRAAQEHGNWELIDATPAATR